MSKCTSNYRKSLGILALAVLLTACGAGSSNSNNSEASATISPKSNSVPAPNATSEPQPSWIYGITQGDAFHKAQSYASLNSTNLLNFQFPYDGPQHANLTIMGDTIIISIEKGQFDCDDNGDGCLVLAMFDGGPVQQLTATLPKDGSDSMVFIYDDDNFIKRLAHAKKLNLDVGFYQEGEQELDFNVSGFNMQKPVTNKSTLPTTKN